MSGLVGLLSNFQKLSAENQQEVVRSALQSEDQALIQKTIKNIANSYKIVLPNVQLTNPNASRQELMESEDVTNEIIRLSALDDIVNEEDEKGEQGQQWTVDYARQTTKRQYNPQIKADYAALLKLNPDGYGLGKKKDKKRSSLAFLAMKAAFYSSTGAATAVSVPEGYKYYGGTGWGLLTQHTSDLAKKKADATSALAEILKILFLKQEYVTTGEYNSMIVGQADDLDGHLYTFITFIKGQPQNPVIQYPLKLKDQKKKLQASLNLGTFSLTSGRDYFIDNGKSAAAGKYSQSAIAYMEGKQYMFMPYNIVEKLMKICRRVINQQMQVDFKSDTGQYVIGAAKKALNFLKQYRAHNNCYRCFQKSRRLQRNPEQGLDYLTNTSDIQKTGTGFANRYSLRAKNRLNAPGEEAVRKKLDAYASTLLNSYKKRDAIAKKMQKYKPKRV